MLQFLYYLEPNQYDTRKSFYKKASVFKDTTTNDTLLISYNTTVAKIHSNNTVTVNGWYSQTTARHINEFLAQNGFPTLSKKEMNNDALFPMTHADITFTEPEIITEPQPEPNDAQNNYNYLFGYTDKI